ncbi:MAG: WD40 repeat domain-containing protein [Pseudonocardiaceae bacterium]
MIATPSNDGDVHLWDAVSGGYERALDVDTDYVWAATFSPDGDIVATANDDDTVQLWYRTTGRHVRTLGEHRGRVRSIAFNSGGDLLVTGCDDAAVRLWDAGTGAHLHNLEGHTRRVWSVAFSPDGSQLASAGDDGTVRIWNLRGDPAPRIRMTLLGLPEGWAALAPDGHYKLAGTVTGEFWHVIGTCRFEPGDINLYLPSIRQLPLGAEF